MSDLEGAPARVAATTAVSTSLSLRLAASHAPVAIIVAFSAWTGFVGLDFGRHFDEPRMIAAVQRAITTGRLLPRWYNYPSLSFDLSLFATAVNGMLRWVGGECRAVRGLGACLDLTSRTSQNGLAMRAVFLLVALASALWVYAAARRYSGRVIEATFGAALLALSWEVGYHARWIAPDAILMQFAALAILFAIVYRRVGSRRSVLLGIGLVIGLATATKYPGALLAIPFVVLILADDAEPLPRRLAHLVNVAVVAVAAYVIASPGTILDFRQSLEDISFEMRHYQTGHLGYTVVPGIAHLLLLAKYLALVAFSHYQPVAVVVSVLALLGAYTLARSDRRLCAAILSFPLMFLLYMSRQHVMIVRNVLCTLPFMAFLASLGLGQMRDVMGRTRAAATLVATVACGLLLPNAAWLYSAASTVAHRSERTFDELTEHVSRHPQMRFLLSPRTRNLYGWAGKTPPLSALAPPQLAYVIWSNEVAIEQWAANVPGRYELLPSGPLEVNWDYYPSWIGDSRVVIMGPDVVADMTRAAQEPPPMEQLREP